MKPYVVRCELLGSTGEAPWSTIIRAETPERAAQIGRTAANTYADRLLLAHTRIRVYLMNGEYLMEES